MQPGLSKEPNLSQSPEKVSKIEQKFIENQPCEENQRFRKIQFICEFGSSPNIRSP